MGSLRALLAISVVFAHSPFQDGEVFVGGPLAVQMFYVISGFLIHHVLVRGPRYGRAATFYKSRLLRLLPVYYAVALASLLVAPVLTPGLFDIFRASPAPAKAALGVANLLLIGQDWIMFLGVYAGQLRITSNFKTSELPLHQGLLVPQAWTLGLELAFYALAPLLLRSGARIVSLMLASLALRLYLVRIGIGLEDPWSYRFFPSELALFLLGALSNRLWLPACERWSARHPESPLPALATALALAWTLLYFFLPLPGAIKGPLTIALTALALPLLFDFQNGSALDRAVGELSYPIYIGHMLVIRVLHRAAYHLHLGELPPFWISLANVSGALLFALALNAFVARPCERLRTRVKNAGLHEAEARSY